MSKKRKINYDLIIGTFALQGDSSAIMIRLACSSLQAQLMERSRRSSQF